MNLNPAVVGIDGSLNVNGFFSNSWSNALTSSDRQMQVLNLHGVSSFRNIGWGFSALNDNIGASQHSGAFGSISYTIHNDKALSDSKFWLDKGSLSLGVQFGVSNLETANHQVVKSLDVADSSLINESHLGLAFGIYYRTADFFVGFSANDLLNDSSTYLIRNREVFNNLNLNAGYNIYLSDIASFHPSVLLRFSSKTNSELESQSLQFDINALISLYNRLWVGGAYRNNDSLLFLAKINLNHQFKLNYSYTYELTDQNNSLHGSNQIGISYKFKYTAKTLHPKNF